MTHLIPIAMLSVLVLMTAPALGAEEPQFARNYVGKHPVSGAGLNLTFDQHQVRTLKLTSGGKTRTAAEIRYTGKTYSAFEGVYRYGMVGTFRHNRETERLSMKMVTPPGSVTRLYLIMPSGIQIRLDSTPRSPIRPRKIEKTSP